MAADAAAGAAAAEIFGGNLLVMRSSRTSTL